MRSFYAAACVLAAALALAGCAESANKGTAPSSAGRSAASPQQPGAESPQNPEVEKPQGVTPKVSFEQTPVTEARNPPSSTPASPAAGSQTGKSAGSAEQPSPESPQPPEKAPEATPEKATPEKNPAGPAAKAETTFSATLSGQQEAPPVETKASGKASFELTDDGEKLDYEVAVTDLENATMAHLHMAPKGQNGDVVVWLYPPSGPPPKVIKGKTTGKLVSGTVTDDKLVGPLEGKSVGDLVARIKAGDIYINVHTEAHPDGELRGQVQ